LALIPAQDDMAGQGTLSFTLGMLRGMALDAVNDPQAMAYWQQMLGRASQPGQRPLVELAIGLQAQKALATGGDAAKRDFYALFAPGGAPPVSDFGRCAFAASAGDRQPCVAERT
jgi:hypothetical protein